MNAPASSPTITYGIDFGTSNSAVAAWDETANATVENADLTAQEPSLIYFPYPRHVYRRMDHHFLGNEAISQYVGDNMEGRLLQALKTALSDPSFKETLINGRHYGPADLAAIIIRSLKEKADRILGADVTRAVLGRPAQFHPDPERDILAEKRLRRAAELAGFREIRFQYEPIAAALAYELTLAGPETVIVGDFGGGTSDFTVIRLDPRKSGLKDRGEDILATGGVAIAGNRLDSGVMWEKVTPALGRGATWREFSGAPEMPAPKDVHYQICEWDRLPFLAADRKLMELLKKMALRSNKRREFGDLVTLIQHNLGYSLFQSIEAAKIALTDADRSEIDFHHGDLNLNIPLTIEEFREINAARFNSIGEAIDETLEAAGLERDQIDTCFLTGGTSFVRPIRALFADRFGTEKIRTGEAFLSVARGLALSVPVLY